MDGAGVDLLALVQLGQQAALFQGLGTDGSHIHQGAGTLGSLLLPIHFHPGVQIPLVGRGDLGIVNGDLVQMGGEGGVAAVVGPVGVHHADLGDGGIPLLLVPEVSLQELQVIQVHGQTQTGQQVLQSLLVHGDKALHGVHVVGSGVGALQGVRLVHGSLPALHGVNEVLADLLQILLADGTHQQVHLGGGNDGAVHTGLELDALLTGVGPLVVLAGQGLHRQHLMLPLRGRELLVIDHVHLGLREHHALGGLIDLGIDAVGIVAVQDANRLQPLHTQLLPQLAAQALGLYIKARSLLGITAVNTHVHSSTRYPNSFYFTVHWDRLENTFPCTGLRFSTRSYWVSTVPSRKQMGAMGAF